MSHVQENSNRYVPSELSRGRSQLQYELFIGRVLSVDQERICLTVEDIRDNTVYSEVRIFPAEHSSVEATSITMPEQFSTCVACNIQYQQGFSQIAILSWVTGSVAKALDAIAFRPVSGTVIQGLSDRLRGTYRKAYRGKKPLPTQAATRTRLIRVGTVQEAISAATALIPSVGNGLRSQAGGSLTRMRAFPFMEQ